MKPQKGGHGCWSDDESGDELANTEKLKRIIDGNDPNDCVYFIKCTSSYYWYGFHGLGSWSVDFVGAVNTGIILFWAPFLCKCMETS